MILVYVITIALLIALCAALAWLGPYLDRWERAEYEAEAERRRPKGPRPPYMPPSQHPRTGSEPAILKFTPRRVFECELVVGPCRIDPDIEDEP